LETLRTAVHNTITWVTWNLGLVQPWIMVFWDVMWRRLVYRN